MKVLLQILLSLLLATNAFAVSQHAPGDFYLDAVKAAPCLSTDANGKVVSVSCSGSSFTETDPVFTASSAFVINTSSFATWNSGSGNFVPYIGATGSVNLGAKAIVSTTGTFTQTLTVPSTKYLPTTTDQTNWDAKQAALSFTGSGNTVRQNSPTLSGIISTGTNTFSTITSTTGSINFLQPIASPTGTFSNVYVKSLPSKSVLGTDSNGKIIEGTGGGGGGVPYTGATADLDLGTYTIIAATGSLGALGVSGDATIQGNLYFPAGSFFFAPVVGYNVTTSRTLYGGMDASGNIVGSYMQMFGRDEGGGQAGGSEFVVDDTNGLVGFHIIALAGGTFPEMFAVYSDGRVVINNFSPGANPGTPVCFGSDNALCACGSCN